MVSVSIRTKVFLTLLIAGSLAVAGMHAFMSWSFNNGLVEFAETRRQERLELIAERLVERYQADAGWQRIAGDKGIWIGILTDYARPPHYPLGPGAAPGVGGGEAGGPGARGARGGGGAGGAGFVGGRSRAEGARRRP